MIVAIVLVCGADDIILPWYFSFMEVMCDLSASIASIFKSIRCSLSPVGTGGGCGIVTSKTCSFVMDWFVCFASGDRRIGISAGPLMDASGISPIGSMMVSYAVYVLLASVSSGRSVVVASVFVMASCSAVLEVQGHSNTWSPYLSNVVLHIWWLMCNRSFCWIHRVKDSLCNWFAGSFCGKLCIAMLVSGLSKLGRNVLMLVGIIGRLVV